MLKMKSEEDFTKIIGPDTSRRYFKSALVCIVFFPVIAFAQQFPQASVKGVDSAKVEKASTDSIPQKDLSDVIGSIFNKNKSPGIAPDTVTSKPVFSVVGA